MLNTLLKAAVGAAILLAPGMTATPATAAEYLLRYSEIGPPRGPRAEAMQWWANELKERSGGRIEIEFYWSQSLLKGKATLKGVGSGIAEMGTVLGIYTPAELPVWNYANMPFAVNDVWVGMRTWHELRQVRPELNAETDKYNVKVLGQYSTGAINLLSKETPILTTEDLAGKKIRANGGIAKMFEALGAVPVSMGFAEIYAALDRGTIDATITYTPYVKSYKHYEVADQLTETSLGQILGYGPAINLKLFNEMPADLQNILVKTTDEMIDVYARLYIQSVDAAKAELQAGIDGKTVTFHEFSAEQREIWRKPVGLAIADWKEKMAEKGVDADAFLDAFETIRAKYEAELKANGYPWDR